MDDYPETFRMGELWSEIREGKIECEPNLKTAVLDTVLNYGTTKAGTGHIWIKRNPLSVVNEIITDLLTDINRRETHTHEEMTEAELDFHRQLRVRFIRIRRAVRTILKEQENET